MRSSSADAVRIRHLKAWYTLLEQLVARVGTARQMSECHGKMNWPQRGVYFFQEHGEHRTDTGAGARIVRVGSHALKANSKTTLWKRLSQHKGVVKSGGGNHRGSIFRLLVGTALLARDGESCATWGVGNSTPKDITAAELAIELAIERRVSDAIGRMRVLCLPIDDGAGPGSLRGVIERNSIALLSNYERFSIDAPSQDWLGHHCAREKVGQCGLWNQRHANETYDPSFLTTFEKLVTQTARY